MAALQVEKEGESIAIYETVSTGKIHPYILNNVKAKNVLVTNAKLDPVNKPIIKPNTTQVQLNTGAYKKVVFLLLDSWSQALKGDTPELSDLEGIKVTVLKVRDDTDQTKKKMDALVHLRFNQDSIQIFFYHTNQSLMVQGPSHQPFYNTFLLSSITEIVNDATQEINEFNSLVIRTLSNLLNQGLNDSVWRSATPDRHHNLRLMRNKATKCEVCGKNCASKSQLKVHMDTNHNGGLALAAKPRAGVTATRTASSHQRQLTMVQGQNILSSASAPSTPRTLPPPSSQQSTLSIMMSSQTSSTSCPPGQVKEAFSNPLKAKEVTSAPSQEAAPLEGLQVLLETVRDSLILLIPSSPLPSGSQVLASSQLTSAPDLALTLGASKQRIPKVPLKEAGPPDKEAGPPFKEVNPELNDVAPDPEESRSPLLTPAGVLARAHQDPDRSHHDLLPSMMKDAKKPSDDIKLSCEHCEFNANDTNELMKHKIHSHAARVKLKCYFCPYYSNTKDALTEHLEQHKQDGHLSASGRLLIPDYGFNLDVYNDVIEDKSFFEDDVVDNQTTLDPTPTLPATPARNRHSGIEIDESFDVFENETCTVCKLKFRNVTVLQEHLLARHCVQSQDVAELLRMQQQLLNEIITMQTKQQQDITKLTQSVLKSRMNLKSTNVLLPPPWPSPPQPSHSPPSHRLPPPPHSPPLSSPSPSSLPAPASRPGLSQQPPQAL